MEIDVNIISRLSQEEKEIFSIIQNVIKNKTPSTQAFAVGGWTRDKLLGKKSNDIDIMVDDVSGSDFAKMVTSYIGVKDPHVIRENPEKSKFITTAKAYIPLSNGVKQEVDFAQARSEVYDNESRIPTIKTATPQADAFRRDLTINSIFFRINDFKIIDFTGKGIADLQNNIIRTPQDPLKTFKEDPLRTFRCVRFSAKYNFKIDPATYAAMMDPSLRDEIKKKVSKERVGEEIKKTLSNPNAQYAITLLKDTGLLEDILSESLKGTEFEGKVHPSLDMDQQSTYHNLTLWEHTMEVVKNVIEKYKDMEPEKRIVMILSALMHDLGKLSLDIQKKTDDGHTSYHGHEESSGKIVEHILRYLKMEPYIKEVSNLVKNHMKLHHRERDSAGLRSFRRFIREMGEISLNWIDVFNLSVADAYAKDRTVDEETVKDYQEMESKLKEALTTMSPLSDPSKPKVLPVLNGNEIMAAFDNKKPGPWVKTVTNWLLDVQDQDPSLTKEDAIKRIKANFPEFSNVTKQAKCSKILLDSTVKKVNDILNDKPTESVSLINKLVGNNPDDEDVIAAGLRTAIYATLKLKKTLISSDMIELGKKIAKKNFLDPEINRLLVVSKALCGGKLQESDIKCLKLSLKMDPKGLEMVNRALPHMGESNKSIIISAIQ